VLKLLAQGAVGRDATANYNGRKGVVLHAAQGAFYQGPDDCGLKASGNIFDGYLTLGCLGLGFELVGEPEDGGFEAAKAGIVGMVAAAGERDFALGEPIGCWVAGLGEPVNDGAARIAKIQQPGNFIKGFSGGIVAGFSENVVVAGGADVHEAGVSAGDQKAQERGL